MKKAVRAPCPRCGNPSTLDTTNPWRPFCSERCKLVDLGDWMAARHVIPGDDVDPEAAASSGDGEDPYGSGKPGKPGRPQ